jgi:uncharacterized protein (DUF433 family)
MTETATTYEHIVLRDGAPSIAGTSVKVIELVLDKMAYGWSPEEMHLQHPHLSLGQIHSALAYYWDHAEALDAEIERRLEASERLRSQATPPPLVAKLRARGLLR